MIHMKPISVILYSLALILTFSPAFCYMVLSSFLSVTQSTAQAVSVAPMIVGIALLVFIKHKKSELLN